MSASGIAGNCSSRGNSRPGFRARLFIAARWAISGRRTAHRSRLLFASAGIAAGIVALVVVLSVMNGFQGQYIDALLETTSFHARMPVSAPDTDPASLRTIAGVRSVMLFFETNLLASGRQERQAVLRVMFVEPENLVQDKGFLRALRLTGLGQSKASQGMLIGSEAARMLGIREGDTLDFQGAVMDPEEGLRVFRFSSEISGIFRSGYYELDKGFAIIPLSVAQNLDLPRIALTAGIKLHNPSKIDDFAASAAKAGIKEPLETWREYNRSFFSALRTEKIVMFFLVSIIFAVVSINIHYSMRRTISRKSRDLAILAATGCDRRSLALIFVLQGLLVGIIGAVAGCTLGIFVASHIDAILNGTADILQAILSLFHRMGLVSQVPDMRLYSPEIFYLDAIPVRILASDVALIALFAVLFPTLAIHAAFRRSANASPQEVLRSE